MCLPFRVTPSDRFLESAWLLSLEPQHEVGPAGTAGGLATLPHESMPITAGRGQPQSTKSVGFPLR